jgi:cytochrome c-type biogenesis protein CcmH
MTLWLVLTVMIAVAAVLVSTPFIRRFERSRLETAGHLAVYRDQLNAIDSEAAQGLIDEAQAESARLEIKRKVLAADRADEPARPALGPAERKFALTAVTAIVTFGSILLYAVVGSPELPSASPAQARMEQPLGARLTLTTPPSTAPAARLALTTPPSAEPAARLALTTPPSAGPAARLALTTPPSAEPAAPQTTAQPQTGLPSVEEMTQRLQAKLQRNPQDVEGWRMLGWAYFNIEHFADAANAYSKAIELRPDTAEYRSARGEALVREAGGTVSVAAKTDFEDALKLDPKDGRARFFIGLAKQQGGDKVAALADWSTLLAEANPTEPWFADLKQRVAELQRELGDKDAALPSPAPKLSADAMRDFLQSEKAKQPPAETDRRGPSAEDIRNAESMAPKDRTAMIRGMVDGLASRLEQQPRDAEGWIKLIRSRVVLGDTELANQSLEHALTIFREDGPERTRIVEAARQLGLNP